MGAAGLMKPELESDRYFGMNTGWSPISMPIFYTEKEKKIVKRLNWQVNYVNDIYAAEFCERNKGRENSENRKEERVDVEQIQILTKWKLLLENRVNRLLELKRKMISPAAVLSIQASSSEVEMAYQNVLELLAGKPDIVYSKELTEKQTEEDYMMRFAEALLERLLSYIKENVFEEENAIPITQDLQVLAAIGMNAKNSDNEYICSKALYEKYLLEKGLKDNHRECESESCRADITFADYRFCLVCGKRVV